MKAWIKRGQMLLCLLLFIAGCFLLLPPTSRKGVGNSKCSESSSCILYFSCLCYSVKNVSLNRCSLTHWSQRFVVAYSGIRKASSQRLGDISVFTLDINQTVIYLLKPGCRESLTLVLKSGTMNPLCSQGFRALWTRLGDSILHGTQWCYEASILAQCLKLPGI